MSAFYTLNPGLCTERILDLQLSIHTKANAGVALLVFPWSTGPCTLCSCARVNLTFLSVRSEYDGQMGTMHHVLVWFHVDNRREMRWSS